jgi:formate hydrogenlyase transcriptional activator
LASHSQALEHDSDSRSSSGAEFSSADRATPPAEVGDAAALQAIAEGTAQSTGAEFFRKLVQHLARALGVEYAMVAEFAGESRVRTLAYWKQGVIADNLEYDLPGTPCEDVVRGNLCHHPSGVARKFPQDVPLTEMAIESYLGVPLVARDGRHLGHLCVFDRRSMPAEPQQLLIFKIFAARAAAELERLRIEQSLIESEQRYRDLFEEAPIAYVLEDVDSRFIKANHAAIRILGLKPEEVAGTLGMSLVAETPENKRRIREALTSAGQGASVGGFVVELRRKDNGNPVWVQWWSKPEPNGKFTRTMIVDITERVLMEQERARMQEQARLRAQNLYLQEEIKADHNFEEIVGQSVPLLHVLENVRRVAPTDASVLISGETGTGKELIARAIHSNSKRRDRPLIKVNCAALPTGLVESELFGHEKGAFTGAIARRIGRFELADGGTIFLDEIGEIPLEVQVKLLRVLQEREFDRVGGGKAPISVDVRVIAATNRDLLAAVREKKFREDLYYRLNVFPLRLPPLRERKADISLLAHFLVKKFATSIGKSIERISAEALERLDAYDWPGNVRELENVIERAVILSSRPVLDIDPDVFVPRAVGSPSAVEESSQALEEVERAHICKVLEETSWIIEGTKGAARVLGLHPNTLRSRLKKLGIARPPLDSSSCAADGAPT